jgi:hypothetical protein
MKIVRQRFRGLMPCNAILLFILHHPEQELPHQIKMFLAQLSERIQNLMRQQHRLTDMFIRVHQCFYCFLRIEAFEVENGLVALADGFAWIFEDGGVG